MNLSLFRVLICILAFSSSALGAIPEGSFQHFSRKSKRTRKKTFAKLTNQGLSPTMKHYLDLSSDIIPVSKASKREKVLRETRHEIARLLIDRSKEPSFKDWINAQFKLLTEDERLKFVEFISDCSEAKKCEKSRSNDLIDGFLLEKIERI